MICEDVPLFLFRKIRVKNWWDEIRVKVKRTNLQPQPGFINYLDCESFVWLLLLLLFHFSDFIFEFGDGVLLFQDGLLLFLYHFG
jgi:hypothetical protein